MRLLAAFLALALSFAASAEVSHIDNETLAKLVAAGAPIIDIRTEGEWKETGVVAGSHLITFFDERGRADPAAWLAKVAAIAKPGEPVVVICRTGNRTRAVADFLDRQAGYKSVHNVKAGIHGWLREGRPVVAAASRLAACPAGEKC